MQSCTIKRVLSAHPYIKVPEEFQKDIDEKRIIEYINGCGAATGLFTNVAPSQIDGICILAACIIHDFRYYKGQTLQDKIRADIEFLLNIQQIIINDPSFYKIDNDRRQLRLDEALIFFRFVHEYGLKSFVEKKNTNIIDEEPLCSKIIHSLSISFRALCIPFYLIGNLIRAKLVVRKLDG